MPGFAATFDAIGRVPAPPESLPLARLSLPGGRTAETAAVPADSPGRPGFPGGHES